MRVVLKKYKQTLKPNLASHNTISWYTDTDGFLEYSPSGGSLYYKGPNLQKIIPVFYGSPLYKCKPLLCFNFCTLYFSLYHQISVFQDFQQAYLQQLLSPLLICCGGETRYPSLLELCGKKDKIGLIVTHQFLVYIHLF